MVGRPGIRGHADRRLGKAKRLQTRSGPALFDPPSQPAAEPCYDYFSAAFRAVFRLRRRASAAFKALASLGFT
jgi:hypothetical protein